MGQNWRVCRKDLRPNLWKKYGFDTRGKRPGWAWKVVGEKLSADRLWKGYESWKAVLHPYTRVENPERGAELLKQDAKCFFLAAQCLLTNFKFKGSPNRGVTETEALQILGSKLTVAYYDVVQECIVEYGNAPKHSDGRGICLVPTTNDGVVAPHWLPYHHVKKGRPAFQLPIRTVKELWATAVGEERKLLWDYLAQRCPKEAPVPEPISTANHFSALQDHPPTAEEVEVPTAKLKPPSPKAKGKQKVFLHARCTLHDEQVIISSCRALDDWQIITGCEAWGTRQGLRLEVQNTSAQANWLYLYGQMCAATAQLFVECSVVAGKGLADVLSKPFQGPTPPEYSPVLTPPLPSGEIVDDPSEFDWPDTEAMPPERPWLVFVQGEEAPPPTGRSWLVPRWEGANTAEGTRNYLRGRRPLFWGTITRICGMFAGLTPKEAVELRPELLSKANVNEDTILYRRVHVDSLRRRDAAGAMKPEDVHFIQCQGTTYRLEQIHDWMPGMVDEVGRSYEMFRLVRESTNLYVHLISIVNPWHRQRVVRVVEKPRELDITGAMAALPNPASKIRAGFALCAPLIPDPVKGPANDVKNELLAQPNPDPAATEAVLRGLIEVNRCVEVQAKRAGFSTEFSHK